MPRVQISEPGMFFRVAVDHASQDMRPDPRHAVHVDPGQNVMLAVRGSLLEENAVRAPEVAPSHLRVAFGEPREEGACALTGHRNARPLLRQGFEGT